MVQYLDLLQDVLTNGTKTNDRTGVGTYSVFGRQVRFDLSKGFPLLTTKKVHMKAITHELVWFMRGDTNIKYLNDNGVTIWDEWADRNGDLGPVYAAMWRKWPQSSDNIIWVNKRVPPMRDSVKIPTQVRLTPTSATELCGTEHTDNSGARYTVIDRVHQDVRLNSRYIVQYESGGVTEVSLPNIKRGMVEDPHKISYANVGCIGGNCGEPSKKHKRIYQMWCNMLSRCYISEHPAYHLYGGKGVYVSGEWLYFPKFLQDVSRLPNYEKWLLRPGEYEIDKDYYGADCYSLHTSLFLTRRHNKEMSSGQPVSVIVDGVENLFMCKYDAAKHLKICGQTLQNRLNGKHSCRKGIKIAEISHERDGKLMRREVFKDQIADLIKGIKEEPFSRRHIVTAWNPAEVDDMALPPCHCLFQFHVEKHGTDKPILSCQLYQRSADIFLGVPFNIASYAMLTHIIAQLCDMQVGEFIHTFGDLHLYSNHVEQAKLQLARQPMSLPKIYINSDLRNIDDLCYTDIVLHGYESHPRISAPIAV